MDLERYERQYCPRVVLFKTAHKNLNMSETHYIFENIIS